MSYVVAYTVDSLEKRSQAFGSFADADDWKDAAVSTFGRSCRPEVVPAVESDGPAKPLEKPVLIICRAVHDAISGQRQIQLNGKVYTAHRGPGGDVRLMYADAKGVAVVYLVSPWRCECKGWQYVYGPQGLPCRHMLGLRKLGLLTAAATKRDLQPATSGR